LERGQRGFAFVEVIAQCPTQFGRRNLELSKGIEMLKWFKEITVSREKVSDMRVKHEDKLILGEFIDRKRQGFTERVVESYKNLIKTR
jgi:2-oxoglutarate ferredoxin oxidoreductase subunit beta